jgi:hypothetical protein
LDIHIDIVDTNLITIDICNGFMEADARMISNHAPKIDAPTLPKGGISSEAGPKKCACGTRSLNPKNPRKAWHCGNKMGLNLHRIGHEGSGIDIAYKPSKRPMPSQNHALRSPPQCNCASISDGNI